MHSAGTLLEEQRFRVGQHATWRVTRLITLQPALNHFVGQGKACSLAQLNSKLATDQGKTMPRPSRSDIDRLYRVAAGLETALIYTPVPHVLT